MNLNQFDIKPQAGDPVYAPNLLIGGAKLANDLPEGVSAPVPLKIVGGSNKFITVDVAEAGDTIMGVLKREAQKSVYKKNDVVGMYRALDIIHLEASADITAGAKVYFDATYKVTPTSTGAVGLAGTAQTDAKTGETVFVVLSCQLALA